MTAITHLLSDDHLRCDDLFAEAEAAIAKEDWSTATGRFAQFREAMAHHFSAEEDTLFPAFEAATGMSHGPTQVMRSEHAEMNTLMDAMQTRVDGRDRDGYLGLSETLLMLMRQHNLKEEQILYPMSDQALGASPELLAQIEATLGGRA